MTWHVDTPTARRYADRDLDGITSASIEAHVMDCSACRELVGRTVDASVLDAIWFDVDAALDQPTASLTHHVMRRVGLGDTSARLLSATIASRWSYLVAVGLSLFLAVLASLRSDAPTFTAFVVVAPLGPLMATAVAFGRWTDSAFELVATVPVTALRLLMLRVVAAVVPALSVTALSIPWSLDRGWHAVAWLVPALALSAAVIALSTWVPIESAAIGVGAAWLSVPFVATARSGRVLELLVGPVQVAAVVAAVAAVAVATSRRHCFEYRER